MQLGRGLAALFGETTDNNVEGPIDKIILLDQHKELCKTYIKYNTQPVVENTEEKVSNDIINQSVSHVDDCQGNLDSTYNISCLIESIKKYGVLEPILVTSNIDDTYNLVAGLKRYVAVKILGLLTIPIRIIEKNNNTDFIYLIENIHRNPINPLDIATILYKYKNEDLSKILCISQCEIDKYLSLLSLPSYIQDLVKKGKINLNMALCIKTLNEKQIEFILRENWSLKRIKNYVNKINLPIKDAPDDNLILPTKNEEAEEIAKRIENKLKIPTKLLISKKGGALTIICKTYDELDRIVEKLL